jgi:hypothetical protein
VLTEDYTAAADHSANQQCQAKPPYRIKIKNKGERQQRTVHCAGSSGVSTDTKPIIDNGTDKLYHQGTCQNAYHNMRYVKILQENQTTSITYQGDVVRYESQFPLCHLVPAQTAQFPVKRYA